MSIAFVRLDDDTAHTNNTSWAVSADPATADGNLLLAAQGTSKGTQITLTPPAQFTDIADEAAGGNSSDTYAHSGYRIASGDAGASWTWSFSPSCAGVAAIVEYSGVDTTTPIDTATPSAGHDISTVPGITTTVDGCLLVIVLVLAAANTLSAVPSGWTKRFDVATSGGTGTDPRLIILDAPQATAGATGDIALTVSSAVNDTAIMFALRPAASGGSVSADASAAATITSTATASLARQGNATQTATGTATATANLSRSGDATQTVTVTQSATATNTKTAGAAQTATVTATASANVSTSINASQTATVTATATHSVPAVSTPAPTTNVAGWPLTAAQIAVLQSPALTVDFGVELLDSDDSFVEDISTDVVNGEIDRDNYATIHGTCKLNVSRALQWGAARARPYMLLTAGNLTVRWNLGVYLLTTPDRPVGEIPATYSAVGYDKLYLLGQLIGDAYAVTAGTDVLTAVSAVITASGVGGQVNIDGTAQGKTLASDMVWPLDEQHQASYLVVINDLLATIGYRGMWADRDGALRADPYQLPADRAQLWSFDADDPYLSLTGIDRTETQDLFPVPNKWLFIQRGLTSAPTEGAGQYTVTTADSDPTSAVSLGYLKRKVVFFDAADQAALQAQGDQQVATDRQVTQTLTLTTAPFPVAWHFDVYAYSDSLLGGEVKVLARSWTLPLDGSDMSHVWEVVQ